MKNFKYILLVLIFTVPVMIHALLNTTSLHGVGVMLAYAVLGVAILGALGLVFVLPMFGSGKYASIDPKKEDDSYEARRAQQEAMNQQDMLARLDSRFDYNGKYH